MHRSALALLALSFAAGGCSSSVPALASGAVPPGIAVDGMVGDWTGALRPVANQPGLSLGLRNDGDAMYVLLSANTPEQAMRLARGVTFWFDGAGDTRRSFGVSYPSAPERGIRDDNGGFGTERDDRDRMARTRARFEEHTRTMTVHRGRGETTRVGLTDVPGIQPAARWTDAGLVVELRVPLAPDASGYTVGASGGTIGLGIELADLQVATRPPAAARGGGEGRRSGGSAGVGVDRRGGGERPFTQNASTSTTWLEVLLVSARTSG